MNGAIIFLLACSKWGFQNFQLVWATQSFGLFARKSMPGQQVKRLKRSSTFDHFLWEVSSRLTAWNLKKMVQK